MAKSIFLGRSAIIASISAIAGVFLASSAWAASPALPGASGIQAGLWEMKITKQLLDGKDMQAQMAAAQAQMAEVTKNMPPAQRKQMEEMMSASMGTGSAKVCISPAMAAMDKPIPPKGMQCETLKLNRSAGGMSYEMRCSSPSESMQGKGQSSFGRDWVKSSMDMTTKDARGQHRMQMDSELRFVGKDCGAVKPLGELVKDASAAATKMKR